MADAEGRFDWSMPDEEVHAAVNDLERTTGTMLLGRRMYEVLVAWQTLPTADEPAVMQDFARIWHGTDKVVYSRTLREVASERTSLERAFEPEAVRQLKASSERDLSIGGAELAGQAFAAGLIDECHLFLNPIAVGGGTAALPRNQRIPPRARRGAALRGRRRASPLRRAALRGTALRPHRASRTGAPA